MAETKIACLKCGESSPDLLDISRSPSGQIVHIQCNVCSSVSFITEYQVRTCSVCKGMGSHTDGCHQDRPWGV